MTESATLPRQVMSGFDPASIRGDFPALDQAVHGHPLVYLDNAATTQKPQAVIDAVANYYRHDNANVHRGVHQLSERATDAYESARRRVARLINAADPREIIFARGCTEGINLVASSYGRSRLGPGDEVLITHMEHHSNIVPWQMVCAETGARLVVAPITDDGRLDLGAVGDLLGPQTAIVAVTHVSNALGTRVPIADVVAMAKSVDAVVLVDGAQAVPHQPVDVQALGCDFYAFSGHKMYGPTGIGALYGRADRLAEMPPYQGGGEMIRTVTFDGTTFAEPPARFEAGTPNIAGAIGLGAAVDYLSDLNRESIVDHEARLMAYAADALEGLGDIRLFGPAGDRVGALSFEMFGVHPHDVGTILDREGIAVRAGHHCAQPVMDRYGVPATVRASFGLYNTTDDVDRLVAGLRAVRAIFGNIEQLPISDAP